MQERKADKPPNLFSPLEVGPLVLRNRVVMAPFAGPGERTHPIECPTTPSDTIVVTLTY
jgi:2,4-dienoyl-CoA reductase-like NADH-dependent reductase (Old Yellow Enzyme family)